RILEAMNRHHTPEEFEHIVEILRNKSPNMCLATDVITGFPGETDDDHHATVELLGRVRPDIVNVTRYSPRPGTDAARSQNQIPGWIRKERSREISALRMRISKELYCSHIGMEKDILITEYGKRGTMIGRTDSYRPVVVKGKHVIGTRLPIIVVDATSTYMIGEYQGI
ncbi:MAG: TRAM domain-containing protein, partial [Euryarchaeota archaeon]|nr:TRAM domain-containing protein [Euryarchaeota archaeon]